MNILDFLPSDDLAKVAVMSPRFADIILNRYIISKFGFHENQATVLIGDEHCFLFHDGGGKRVFLSSDLNGTLAAIQLIGHILKDLRYEVSEFGSKKIQVVFEYAEKFCPQATKEIEINRFDKAVADWTYTFDHTTTQVSIRPYGYGSMSLNNLFPFMETLFVDDLRNTITQHYPRLTYCSIRSIKNDHKNPNVYEFIRLNPQLRHFHTTMRGNATYMKYLSEMLPNLESLSIKTDCFYPSDFTSESVRFESVKQFSLILGTGADYIATFHKFIGDIHFNKLEALTMWIHYNDVADNRPIEFITANRDLKKLNTNILIAQESYVDLLEALPKLEEIQLRCNDGEEHSFAPLLTSNHNLSKISIRDCYNLNVEDFERIAPLKWRISETSLKAFHFVRIN